MLVGVSSRQTKVGGDRLLSGSKAAVRCGQIERRGIKTIRSPFDHRVVFAMARVRQDLYEVLVTGGAAAVLWWTSAGSVDTDGVAGGFLRFVDGFDHDIVLPAVTEVVVPFQSGPDPGSTWRTVAERSLMT